MSINGVNNPLLSNLTSIPRPDTTRPDASRPGATRTDRLPTTNTGGSAPLARPTLPSQAPIVGNTQQAVPSEAPAGTDPALWSVLTTEERNFFAKSSAFGPLTYGRVKAAGSPTPPAARGVRLDVRA